MRDDAFQRMFILGTWIVFRGRGLHAIESVEEELVQSVGRRALGVNSPRMSYADTVPTTT